MSAGLDKDKRQAMTASPDKREHLAMNADVENTEILLSAEHVAFSYENHEVLQDVSLSVRTGSCTCLMGVNGCGKSTFLDCVLGEYRVTRGTILLGGMPVSGLKPSEAARLVAYVPQVHERSFPYTVEHIVLMGRSVWSQGWTPARREIQEAWAALKECGITHLARRPYTSLSGGEMQMVLLARALAQRTPLIVMDEPTAHLDFKNELLFLETVEHLVKERGVGILMATHSPNQAFHLANAGVPTRVALMHEGIILRDGPPRLILDETTLREVFGVEALLLKREADERSGGRAVCQIVPQRTITRQETQSANSPPWRGGTGGAGDGVVRECQSAVGPPRPFGAPLRGRGIGTSPETTQKTPGSKDAKR
jgi:iron complex transport system ATP-binding protein